MKKQNLILYLLLFFWGACTPEKHLETIFRQADSLLVERPDSALYLLETLADTCNLSHKESAYYALLLARATDKCEKSLLPCDSLLDLALDYYDSNQKERAITLLYKGRLEIEMGQSERAIDFLLEGLDIIRNYPEEIETKRHLLSSLGNEYYNARLYEKAKNTFDELYRCCYTDKDKAIALYNLGHYYDITGNVDSVIRIEKLSFEYAIKAVDSVTMAASALVLSMNLEADSALYYARIALKYLPFSRQSNISNYYANLADVWYEENEYDSAFYYLEKGLISCNNINQKASLLLSLADIAEENGEYKKKADWQDEFIEYADSLCFADQSKIQQLIQEHEIQSKIHEEQIRNKNKIFFIVLILICLVFLVVLHFQYRITKQKKVHAINKQKLEQAQEKYSNLQHSINESQRIIALLQKERSDFTQETEKYKEEIAERETMIKKLSVEKEKLRIWLFKQSSVYKKILKLSEQKANNKKDLIVLTNTEQSRLKEVIMELYADFISDMKTHYPLLTEEDLLYLCLEKAELSNQTIALCFGNTDTHIIAQRKYRIKERMNRDYR